MKPLGFSEALSWAHVVADGPFSFVSSVGSKVTFVKIAGQLVRTGSELVDATDYGTLRVTTCPGSWQ